MGILTKEEARTIIDLADKRLISCLANYQPKTAELSRETAAHLSESVKSSLGNCPADILASVLEKCDFLIAYDSDTLEELAQALRSRFQAVSSVAAQKKEEGHTSSYDETRHLAKLADVRAIAQERGLNADFIVSVFGNDQKNGIMDHCVRYQNDFLQGRGGPVAQGIRNLTISA